MIKLKSLIKEYWEPSDAEILAVAEMNSPADDDYQPSKGERLPRVVWDVQAGQDIKTHRLSNVGLRGDGQGVYGLHVSGDTDYWMDRMDKDFGRDPQTAKVIEIISNEGDMLVDDPQYATDPETGDKASSFVLLTKRNVLKYGRDWVFK